MCQVIYVDTCARARTHTHTHTQQIQTRTITHAGLHPRAYTRESKTHTRARACAHTHIHIYESRVATFLAESCVISDQSLSRQSKNKKRITINMILQLHHSKTVSAY